MNVLKPRRKKRNNRAFLFLPFKRFTLVLVMDLCFNREDNSVQGKHWCPKQAKRESVSRKKEK